MSWWALIAVGFAWIVVVVGTLIVSLVSAESAATTGVANDPGSARVVIAGLSGAIFGLPGVFMIVAGLRRRRPRTDPSSQEES